MGLHGLLAVNYFFLLVLEREKGRRETENHRCEKCAPTYNLHVCPDEELNPQPLGAWDDVPTNGATLARAAVHYFYKNL